MVDKKNLQMILLGTLVLVVAALLRALPLFQFSAWGIDFGIHSGLAQTFIDTGKPFPTYNGWGASYQYFPLLYWITGGIAKTLGVESYIVLPFIPLIFGGAGALFIYWMAISITGRKTTAVFAGLFLAANAIHLCQTSHPYPLTMGHFFILILFGSYFASDKRPWMFLLMFPAGILLLLSHHMSSYMFLIGFLGAVYSRAVLSKWDGKRIARDLVFVGFQFTATLMYWKLFAPPLNRWVSLFFHMPLPLLAMIGVVCIAGSFFILKRFHPHINKFTNSLIDKASNVSGWKLFAVFTSIWALIFFIICLIGMGFLDIQLNPWAFVLALPTILFLGAGCTGLKYLKKYPAILGWVLAILVSLTFATVTWTRALFPERHLEYLVEPLAISAGIGLTIFVDRYGKRLRTLLLERKAIRHPAIPRLDTSKIIPFALVVLIILGGFASAPETISGRYSQGISSVDQDAVEYIKTNCNGNLSIATDHRLGVLINSSNGPACTFEHTQLIWTSDNQSEYGPELEGNETYYPKVGYILIDDNMLNGTLTLVDNGPKGAVVTITDWEYEKFQNQPFELIYRTEKDGHWAEVYQVNWTNNKSTSSIQ